MKTTKYRNKISKGKITDDFQESMLEDMRGPMEGMEEVPAKQWGVTGEKSMKNFKELDGSESNEAVHNLTRDYMKIPVAITEIATKA